MKLIMIGGASATRLSGLIQSSADNVEVTIYTSLYAFIEAASIRSVPADRLFLIEDALNNTEGDRRSQLESFSRFLANNYPQIRAFFMAKTEEVLHEFANIFAAYNYLTLSIRAINPQFVQDVAIQPLEAVAERYASHVVKEDGVNIIANSVAAPAQSAPAAPKPAKKEKRGLFGRRKPANNVGTSPTAPLSPSQSTGFGFNTQTPSGSNFSEMSNGFNTPAQSAPNPFATPAMSTPANPNPFNTPAPAAQSNPDPFASQPASAPNNTDPFASQPVSALNNADPFATQPSGTPATTNPFASPPASSPAPANPFATPAPDTPATSIPTQNTPSQEDDDIDELEEINPPQMGTPFAMQMPISGESRVSPTMETPAQNTPKSGVDNGSNPPRNFARQPQNPAQMTQNSEVESLFGGHAAASPLEQNPISAGGDEEIYEPDFGSNFSETRNDLDSQMGFSSDPYMTTHQQVDKSRLQAQGTRNQYDFKSAQTVRVNRQSAGRQSLEEASAISTAPVAGMMIDDSAYQAQFAPAPRVVEKIVEREVYIDSGTETPAQKLLDAGKQVIIVVTGDRRSGVTYTAVTLAGLYGRRYSTLLVDLDSETCGGQLYQDIEVLVGEDENVQHGVKRAKNPTLLGNLVHHDNDENYDYLFSLMNNEPITDMEIRNLCSALNAQRQFQLVIIDCPWKRINCLDEILMSAKVLLCVDADISGCYNIVRLLGEQPAGNRLTTAVERAGGYIAKFGTSVQNLMQNMAWIHDTFNDDSNIDWTSLRVLGTSDQKGLFDVMKKL